MPDTRHNLPEVRKQLAAMARSFDLRRDGMADKAFDLLAEIIASRFYAMQGLDGSFAANIGSYGHRKAQLGIPVGIGINKKGRATGDMARLENFTDGPRSIRKSAATMTLGANAKDSAKMQWFHGGSEGDPDQPDASRSGAKGQPARRFAGITPDDEEMLLRHFEQAVERFLAGAP